MDQSWALARWPAQRPCRAFFEYLKPVDRDIMGDASSEFRFTAAATNKMVSSIPSKRGKLLVDIPDHKKVKASTIRLWNGWYASAAVSHAQSKGIDHRKFFGSPYGQERPRPLRLVWTCSLASEDFEIHMETPFNPTTLTTNSKPLIVFSPILRSHWKSGENEWKLIVGEEINMETPERKQTLPGYSIWLLQWKQTLDEWL